MTVVPPHDALLSAPSMQQARPEAVTWASPLACHCAATNLAEVVPAAPATSAEVRATRVYSYPCCVHGDERFLLQKLLR